VGTKYILQNIHRLHKSKLGSEEIQWMTTQEDSIAVEALLIKIHSQPELRNLEIFKAAIKTLLDDEL
jgi:hypothetical protein